MCQKAYTEDAIKELQQIAVECPPRYPYGDAPAWWGRGAEAAGQAARDAIELSTRVGDRLRELAGPHGDTLAMRPAIPTLFADEAERIEAYRLLDLAARNRRRIVEKASQNYLDGHVEQETFDESAGIAGARESGAVARPA